MRAWPIIFARTRTAVRPSIHTTLYLTVRVAGLSINNALLVNGCYYSQVAAEEWLADFPSKYGGTQAHGFFPGVAAAVVNSAYGNRDGAAKL